MARHAGSSTARDYCHSNWLFQAWFDTSLLSDPHTSLLSSVMERRWGSHKTLGSSYLQRNRLSRFVSMLRVRIDGLISVWRLKTRRGAHTSIRRTGSAHMRRKMVFFYTSCINFKVKDNSFWYQYLNSSAIGLILYHTFAEFDSNGTLMSLFCFVQLSNNTKFLGILF